MTLDTALEQAVARAIAPLRAEVAELRRALQAQAPDDACDSTEAMQILKSPTDAAFRMLLSRHPDLPRQRRGSRLVFSRAALAAWMGRKGKAK